MQFQSGVRSEQTVTFPKVFYDLTRMKKDFEHIKQTADADVTSTFEDFVVRAEWNQKLGPIASDDERRLDGIGQFIREALHQASVDLPGNSPVLASLTNSGAIMGTPQYMAPEQAWGRIEAVGPPADIYPLGAIMYEMLTGRPPFTGDPWEVIQKVRSRSPVPPRQRKDSIDPALEAICMKCLENNVDRRYESMRNLAEDIQRFMSGAEVSALGEISPSSELIALAPAADASAKTKTYPSMGTTASCPARSKSWWQFWR